MRELDRALSDLSSIRTHLAAGTLFRGYGPAVVAVTGGLAIAATAAQTLFPGAFAADDQTFLAVWIGVAALSAVLIGAEMLARSRRHHGGLADAMIVNAVEQFLPAAVAGAAITAVLMRFAPDAVWMLPGLWQVLVALGIFASRRSLPRAIAVSGAWYLVAGITVLMLAASDQTLSPWLTGLPFAVGQLLLAGILHKAEGAIDV